MGFELQVGDPSQGEERVLHLTMGMDRQNYSLGLTLRLKEYPLLREGQGIPKKHERFRLQLQTAQALRQSGKDCPSTSQIHKSDYTKPQTTYTGKQCAINKTKRQTRKKYFPYI